MSAFQNCSQHITTASGAIDFGYYEKQARAIRSAFFIDFIGSIRLKVAVSVRKLANTAVAGSCG